MSKHLAPTKKKLRRSQPLKGFKMPGIKAAFSAVLSGKTFKSGLSSRKVREERHFSVKELVRAAVALALLAAVKIIRLDGVLGGIICIIPFAVAGYSVLITAFEQALGLRLLERELLVSLACAFSAIAGQFFGGAAIMVLWELCQVLMLLAKEKSVRHIKAIPCNKDGQAKRIIPGGFETVSCGEVCEGDTVEFAPGEVIAFDCYVTEGMSSLELSALTGDKDTRPAAPGTVIASGSVNLTSPIQCRVLRSAKESAAQCFTEAAENAGSFLSRQERLVNEADGKTELYFALAAAAAMILMPVFSLGWRRGFAAAAVILSVPSLRSLGEAIHCCYELCIGKACGEGILVRGHSDLEALSKAETMVFGKTKVVTEGRYEILESYPNGIPEEIMLTFAAAAELHSSHPIAQAIIDAGRRELAESYSVIDVEEIPGRGVSAFVEGKHVYVGNAMLLQDHGIDYRIPSRPGSAVHIAIDSQYAGHILVYDRIKDGAFEAIDELRVNGMKTSVMLTGDVRSTARSVALTLNFDMVKPELSPDAKATAVEYLMATRNINTTLAFIGDGLSDIKALKRASVGVAVGTLDAPQAALNADIAIMSTELRKLPKLYRLSRLCFNVSRICTLAVCGAKAAALCLGVTGIITVGWAAALSGGAVLLAMACSFRPELFR